MSLPKLNSTPKYSITIPSTEQTVKFRPFLVKEEKVLLLAMESNDSTQIFEAIVNTIEACVTDPINMSELTSFDIEYMFIKVRGKSVGESSTIMLKCSDESCVAENEVSIPLDDIKVHGLGDVKNVIVLDETLSVEMRFPSFTTIFNDKEITEATGSVQMFALLRKCIAAILTADERIDLNEYSAKEIDAFVESTNQAQFQQMVKFVEAMPKVKHDVKFNCGTCKKENEFTLEGMQDFF